MACGSWNVTGSWADDYRCNSTVDCLLENDVTTAICTDQQIQYLSTTCELKIPVRSCMCNIEYGFYGENCDEMSTHGTIGRVLLFGGCIVLSCHIIYTLVIYVKYTKCVPLRKKITIMWVLFCNIANLVWHVVLLQIHNDTLPYSTYQDIFIPIVMMLVVSGTMACLSVTIFLIDNLTKRPRGRSTKSNSSLKKGFRNKVSSKTFEKYTAVKSKLNITVKIMSAVGISYPITLAVAFISFGVAVAFAVMVFYVFTIAVTIIWGAYLLHKSVKQHFVDDDASTGMIKVTNRIFAFLKQLSLVIMTNTVCGLLHLICFLSPNMSIRIWSMTSRIITIWSILYLMHTIFNLTVVKRDPTQKSIKTSVTRVKVVGIETTENSVGFIE